jgi:hypothetical protein
MKISQLRIKKWEQLSVIVTQSHVVQIKIEETEINEASSLHSNILGTDLLLLGRFLTSYHVEAKYTIQSGKKCLNKISHLFLSKRYQTKIQTDKNFKICQNVFSIASKFGCSKIEKFQALGSTWL